MEAPSPPKSESTEKHRGLVKSEASIEAYLQLYDS